VTSGFVPDAVDGIAILLWAADPASPHRLATPFFQAAAAGALEIPVEIYFTAASVHLLVPGVAETMRCAKQSTMVRSCMPAPMPCTPRAWPARP
jgi:uncharacterized protein